VSKQVTQVDVTFVIINNGYAATSKGSEKRVVYCIVGYERALSMLRSQQPDVILLFPVATFGYLPYSLTILVVIEESASRANNQRNRLWLKQFT